MKKFKFCPNCKSGLKKIQKKIIHCNQCGFHFYLNPSPTNALILKNEKWGILLVRRKNGPKKGFWDLPGGFAEFGETIEQALKREIKQELAITLKNCRYFKSYCGRYPYKGFIYQPLCFVFTANIVSSQIKKIKAGDDALSFRFFKKEQIPWRRIAFPDIKQALKEFVS